MGKHLGIFSTCILHGKFCSLAKQFKIWHLIFKRNVLPAVKGSYFDATPLKEWRCFIQLINLVKLYPFCLYLHAFLRSLILPMFLINCGVSECR